MDIEELKIVMQTLESMTDGAFWGVVIYVLYLFLSLLIKCSVVLVMSYFCYKGTLKLFGRDINIDVVQLQGRNYVSDYYLSYEESESLAKAINKAKGTSSMQGIIRTLNELGE